jgi:hypothetical protein
MAGSIVKVCGCGATFTNKTFAALEAPPRGGRIRYSSELTHIVRQCPSCGSTIVRALTRRVHVEAPVESGVQLLAGEHLDKVAG